MPVGRTANESLHQRHLTIVEVKGRAEDGAHVHLVERLRRA